MTPTDWAAIGVALTILSGWVAGIHRKLISADDRYMSRREAVDRMLSIEARIDRDIGRVERSNAREFARLHGKLDQIIDAMAKKADR